MSTYTPPWVKTDVKRFPRAKLRLAGGRLETANVTSLFHGETCDADAKAFSKLLAHIKEVDEAHSTVIMVQVENEPGVLGDSRDGSAIANKVFSEDVPSDLLQFLTDEWDTLHPDLKVNLEEFKSRASTRPSGADWATVFGSGPRTDEIFMAYHYANYVDTVAAAGKKVYSIPLYGNVWLNSSGEDRDKEMPTVVGGGGLPGEYPSGGAVGTVLDIWQRFAPTLDLIAPDIYMADYTRMCEKYRHRNQPLFVPEQRRDEYGARRVWIAFGSYAALGTCPFGIDTLTREENPFTKHYNLLKSVSSIVLDAQSRANASLGFAFDEILPDGRDPSNLIVHRFGGYDITIERCFVFGKPGPGSGMIIHQGEGKFLLLGWGFQVSARAVDPDATFTGILRNEEKTVDCDTGELRRGRFLNGDETRSGSCAMMPNEDPDYGDFVVAITIPCRTMIAEVEFYYVKDD